MKIVLDRPITQTSIKQVRVSNIDIQPNRRQVSIRLSLGYENTDGNWVELQDEHELLEDKDQIGIPGDVGYEPAKTEFTKFVTAARNSTKNVDRIVLDRALVRFPGTIS